MGQKDSGINNKQKAFGTASIVLVGAGLLWFVVCFSAPKAAWWNSLWFFQGIFLVSAFLGVIGRKNIRGIIGIILGGLWFVAVSLLLYIG
jgi:hypothetical protein